MELPPKPQQTLSMPCLTFGFNLTSLLLQLNHYDVRDRDLWIHYQAGGYRQGKNNVKNPAAFGSKESL